MSNISRLHTKEITPLEQFRLAHPNEAARLRGKIAEMAKCSDAEAGWVLQEILDAIYAVAKRNVDG